MDLLPNQTITILISNNFCTNITCKSYFLYITECGAHGNRNDVADSYSVTFNIHQPLASSSGLISVAFRCMPSQITLVPPESAPMAAANFRGFLQKLEG